MNLNSKIENQKRGGKGDTLSSNDYYTNSYVERLKALGSDVQYSNYMGGSTGSTAFTDSLLYLSSFYINNKSTLNGVGWIHQVQGDYTADNYNGIGLYSYDAINAKLILIASTTNDGDIWKKTPSGSYFTKNFTIPVTVNSGIYYTGLLYNNSAQVTAPSILSHASQTSQATVTNAVAVSSSAKFYGTITPATSLPAEILNTDINSVVFSQILYLY